MRAVHRVPIPLGQSSDAITCSQTWAIYCAVWKSKEVFVIGGIDALGISLSTPFLKER